MTPRPFDASPTDATAVAPRSIRRTPRARPIAISAAAVATAAALVGTALPATAAQAESWRPAPAASVPQLERLDRGLIAAATPEGVFLSWRLLANEVGGAGESGLRGVDFEVYRGGTLLGTVTDSTNYLDEGASGTDEYRVVPVANGVQTADAATVTPESQAFLDIPLQRPADGVTPVGESYTYSANDASVGDVDGDGEYEFIVKWDPSNSKDVSQRGYTGNVYIDTYKLDGTLLHRLDLGVNIRAGAHYTQFMVYDFDGDGRSEMMLKTAPGTKVITYDESGAVASEDYITMPQSDLDAGFANTDDYRLSAEGYADHVTEIFLGWAERTEVTSGQWPATIEEAFGIPVEYDYPLDRASAEALTDYFLDVYAPGRSPNNLLREFEGFIIDGPEYLSVFASDSGAELQTIPYEPERVDDGLLWGDYAFTRIEPGNRVDRFLAGVAYLDGQRPSAVFARGYYTRATIVAYDWDGQNLSERFTVDSGFVPLTNPFNDAPHGRDGTDPEFGTITTQGFHSLSAADVDGDGKHEIVYGSATIDDDGSLLYSSFDTLPEGSSDPGAEARLGHGDAMHVADIDPARPGLEIFTVHEGASSAPYGYAMRDAATGEVLWGAYTGRDTGRGMIGDIDPDVPGMEAWAVGTRSAAGEPLSNSQLGTNQSIRWAADMTTQIVDGAGNADVVLRDQRRGTVLTATGTRSNNGTKGNPSLVADVFGDWREELVVRTTDSSALRIHFSTEVTDRKLYTLMHDLQYRAEVARQNTVYNQPSYTSFYLASDIDWAGVPIRTTEVRPRAVSFLDLPGRSLDFFIVPRTPGVEYLVDGAVVRPGAYSARGTVTVTARATGFSYIPEGTRASWSRTFSTGIRW